MSKEGKSTGETIAALIGGTVLFSGAVVFIAPLSAIFGAVSGWGVGLFFSGTFHEIFAAIGLPKLQVWQFGAFMGYFSGFMRTRILEK